jgi:hypothetical protein
VTPVDFTHLLDHLAGLEKFLTRKNPRVNANTGHQQNKGDQKMIRMLAEVMTLAMGGYAPRAARKGEYTFNR